MNKYLIVCLLFFNACVYNRDDINFNLKLEGKRYDSLTIQCVTNVMQKRLHIAIVSFLIFLRFGV
jgi:hypothetical protein